MSIRSEIERASGGVVEYDDAFHVYRVDGEVWPSVTQALSVLEDFSGVNPIALQIAGDRGSRVHKLCEQIANEPNELQHYAIVAGEDEWVATRALHFSEWFRGCAPEVLATEHIVVNRALRYCGRCDLIVRLNGKVWLIDIKTGQLRKTVGPQLAGYAAGVSEWNIQKRAALHLTGEVAKLVPYPGLTDMSIFVSALNVWRFKHEP